jgi:hypothetical protein
MREGWAEISQDGEREHFFQRRVSLCGQYGISADIALTATPWSKKPCEDCSRLLNNTAARDLPENAKATRG